MVGIVAAAQQGEKMLILRGQDPVTMMEQNLANYTCTPWHGTVKPMYRYSTGVRTRKLTYGILELSIK